MAGARYDVGSPVCATLSCSLHDVRAALQRPPRRLRIPGSRHAAVAAVLTPELDLLFMLRSTREGDPWSGHVSFPGGRVEPTDPSPLDAAIRETHEELGLHLDRTMLLGELDHVPTIGPLPPMVIHPFVFAVQQPPTYRLNHEVVSVHPLSLDALLDDQERGPMPWRWKGFEITLPRVDFDGVRLWGLTLRMVDDLLDRLDGRGKGLVRIG